MDANPILKDFSDRPKTYAIPFLGNVRAVNHYINPKAQEHPRSWAFPNMPIACAMASAILSSPGSFFRRRRPPSIAAFYECLTPTKSRFPRVLHHMIGFFRHHLYLQKTEMRKNRKKLRIKWQKGIDKGEKIVYNM